MRKKCELLINQINEGKYTGREIMLAGAVLFLAGTLLGMIFSPRKYQVIGSHNGNGSGNGNDAKADAFIRIHANSAGSSSVKGALTIAPAASNPYMTKKNRRASQNLSKKVLKAMCKATGAKNRGVMYTNSMTGINWCKVPVTIVEMGFMSNPSEDRKMASASYQKKIVKGIADGIDKFL